MTFVLCFGCLPATQSTVFADLVAYSNLGAGDSYNPAFAYAVGNQVDPLNIHIAYHFTAEESGQLASVDLAASLVSEDAPDALEVNLWSHNGSTQQPLSLLWSGTVQPTASASIIQATADGSAPYLFVDTDYWISARSLNGNSYYGWYRNDTGATGLYAYDFGGGTSWNNGSVQIQPAFRVNLASVPEPGSLILLASVGAWACWRRRKN